MPILILGSGRSGKDTVAEILRDELGFQFESSSRAAYEIFIYDKLKGLGYQYKDVEEAYKDRHMFAGTVERSREFLFNWIKDYNKEDRTRLARGIVERTGMYVGMRSNLEVQACIDKKVFDLILWVDASKRVDYVESSASMDIDSSVADYIIDNNGSLSDLKVNTLAIGIAHQAYLETLRLIQG